MHDNHRGGSVLATDVPEVTHRHGRRLNNPFPPPAPHTALPLLRGSLSVNPALLGTEAAAAGIEGSSFSYPVGDDFVLTWFPASAHLTLTHRSSPGGDESPIWSTLPGEAFLHAALVRTQVEECRGSFFIQDVEVLAVCRHQEIDEIRVVYGPGDIPDPGRHGSGDNGFESFNELMGSVGPGGLAEALTAGIRFPICLITGWVSAADNTEDSWHGTGQTKGGYSRSYGSKNAKTGRSHSPLAARYWFLLDQKEATGHIGFHVKLGAIESHPHHPAAAPRPSSRSPTRHSFHLKHNRRLRWKLAVLRRRLPWCGSPGVAAIPIAAGFTALKSEDDEYDVGSGRDGIEGSSFNRVYLSYASDPDERFYGFGEQFSHLEFKGRKVPVLVQEQGIGRGDQPITCAANLVSYRAGGDWSTTYAPSPFYMTSKMRSLYLEGYDYSVFDLTKPDRVQIQIHNSSAQGRILYGDSPTQLIERYTEAIGRQPELPSWILSGAIVGMQGGTEAVRRVWKQLQDHDVPISAFWLQDWVGQRETVIGSQLWWNWELDGVRYAGWDELVKDFSKSGIRVMAYCNPCLAPTDGKPVKNRKLLEEARELDILVKDRKGEVYRVANTAFDVGMLDLTHPDAGHWFKRVLHDMVRCGIRGWMADFGEGLPLDAVLYSGEDPVSAHNRYPELWAKVNREFTDEWRQRDQQNGEGEETTTTTKNKADPEDQLVFFMRAGFRNSPRYATLFWEGDQMVSWQRHDGIKSSVVGLLSGGLSGFSLNHSDVGGYCSVPIKMPLVGGYRRSEELLLRWMEVNAFTTVFRTHEGNRPSSNCQFYSNNRTLSHFARFSKVYEAWKFYRIQLVKEASLKGLPVCRHLFLHYPKDDRVHGLTYHQFLVGTEILVVPVLNKGAKRVPCYFPLADGASWMHVWTGKVFGWSTASKPPLSRTTDGGAGGYGFEKVVDAAIGYPAVFVKLGSDVGETFLRNLRDLNVL